MSGYLLFDFLLIGIVFVVFLFVIRIVVAHVVPMEVSGVIYFKKQLKNNGVNVNRVPDAVFSEIVSYIIKSAKGFSLVASMGMDNGKYFKDEKAEMVRLIDDLTPLIADEINGNGRCGIEEIENILKRHGI